MNNSYSIWPMILVSYNLPPWKCMKESYFMMSLLILGFIAPGRDINVYLHPLIDKLKELWDDGVQTYDTFSVKHFCLHFVVMWTINNFLALGNLMVREQRYKTCLVCNENTLSQLLRSKKCFIGHQWFLSIYHPWRKS